MEGSLQRVTSCSPAHSPGGVLLGPCFRQKNYTWLQCFLESVKRKSQPRKSLTKASRGNGSDGHTFILPVLMSPVDPLPRPPACRYTQESRVHITLLLTVVFQLIPKDCGHPARRQHKPCLLQALFKLGSQKGMGYS